MTLDKFVKAHDAFADYLHDECSIPEKKQFPIYDGAVDAEAYFNSPIKLMWLLKEAYDEYGNDYAGKWHYNEILGDDNLYLSFIKPHKSKATWNKIAYLSYSLLNGFIAYNDMDYLCDDHSMAEYIKHTAVVNTKKIPAVGTVFSKPSLIAAAFQKDREVLQAQITLLKPDVIIGGGVLSLYKDMLGLDNPAGFLQHQKRPYYLEHGNLYIDAYHPSYWTVTVEPYIDDIVTIARKWFHQRTTTRNS